MNNHVRRHRRHRHRVYVLDQFRQRLARVRRLVVTQQLHLSRNSIDVRQATEVDRQHDVPSVESIEIDRHRPR